MKNIKEVLIQEVEAGKDELTRTCSELIRIPSENPGGNQTDVLNYVKKYLSALDIEYEELFPTEEFPAINAGFGEDGFNLLFNGHVDVVPAGNLDLWNFDPYGGIVTEDKILGRGASDMKCGLAAMLFACKILKENQVKLKGKVMIHIVSDEETAGIGTEWLCKNGYADQADAVIVCEPTSKTIEIGQKGKLALVLKTRGRSAHGSLGGFKGENAILKLTPALAALSELTGLAGKYDISQINALNNSKRIAERDLQVPGVGEIIDHVSVNVATIKGGDAGNMVPARCEATVDIRVPFGLSRSELEEKIRECLAKYPEVSFELKWHCDANFTDENDPLVSALRENAESLWGFEVTPCYQWATSDAREYRKLDIPTIQYGPSNTEGIHSCNEDVDILDVVNAAKIYIMTICDLLEAEM